MKDHSGVTIEDVLYEGESRAGRTPVTRTTA